jgi:hypothetical protein
VLYCLLLNPLALHYSYYLLPSQRQFSRLSLSSTPTAALDLFYYRVDSDIHEDCLGLWLIELLMPMRCCPRIAVSSDRRGIRHRVKKEL